MSAAELLERLRTRSIQVWAEGGRLRYRAPRGRMTAALRADLARRKAELLELLGSREEGPALVPAPRPDPLPASFAQAHMWLSHRVAPDSSAFNGASAFLARGPLHVGTLRASLAEVVRRHETLRTTFGERDGAPFQEIAAPAAPAVPLVDVQGAPALDGRAALASGRLPGWLRPWVERPFDLARGPLMRVAVLRLAPRRHLLVFVLHHVISDGWSMGVLVRELAALYAAFREGRPSPLPALPVQYADYALWQRRRLTGAALADQLAYWRGRLVGDPRPLELPAAGVRPQEQSFRGGGETLHLSRELTAAARALARRRGATPFMVMLAAFKALLARYSGQRDILVGAPVAGRDRKEVEGLIGFFLNTLVLRTDLSGDPGFGELVDRVRESAVGAFAHQEVPFGKLLEELRPERDLRRTPFFQVLFNMLQVPGSEARVSTAGLVLEPLAVPEPGARFDLTLHCQEIEGAYRLHLVYDRDLFEPAPMAWLLAHFEELLAAAVAAPETRLSELPLTPAAAAAPPVAAAVGAASPEGVEAGWQAGSLTARFGEEAARRPDAVALTWDGTRWSYGEISDRAAVVRQALTRRLPAPGVRVALLLDHDGPMVAAVLGCLAAGAVYVPLDPAVPRSRLAFMLRDAGASLVLATAAHRTLAASLGGVPPAGPAVLTLESLEPAQAAAGGREAPPEALAYLLYTSGSTGEPKAVMQSRGNLLHHVRTYARALAVGIEDRLSLVASYAFDASLMDVFGALLSGAVLCLREVGGTGAVGLGRWLAEERITVFHSTPTLFRHLAGDLPAGMGRGCLRAVVLGGEETRPSDLEHFRERFPPGVLLVNGLGPSESTLALQWFLAGDAEPPPGGVPVGRPVAGTEVELRTPAGPQPAVYGLGEIVLRSPRVALGYWRRPRETAAAFVPDPAGRGGRLYRTGDLGRRLPGGNLGFAGRRDLQVKLRGYRIELAEIESALAGHPAVAAAAVALAEDGGSEPRLIAYVAPSGAGGSGKGVAAALRTHLAARLPGYMVPSVFVPLDALPRTASGKVDRRALPPPPQREAAPSDAEPATPTEELLAELWAEVLGVEEAAPGDHFFELGGHSLLAIRLTARVREAFGCDLPIRAVFAEPTLGAQARRIEAMVAAAGEETPPPPPLRPVSREGPPPASFAQERLWFLDRLEPGSPAYNLAAAVELSGELDAAALAAALGAVVERHESLRTRFTEVGGRVLQQIDPPAGPDLPAVDLTALPGELRPSLARRLAAAEAGRPFDLARGPLARLSLVRLGDGRAGAPGHLLLITLHHAVADGWSLGVLVRETGALYRFRRSGEPASLAPLPVQYADFAVWQRRWLCGRVLGDKLAFWRRELAGAPGVLELPTDRPRPAVQTSRGARRGFALPGDLARDLEALARRRGATLFMVLLAGFQAFLHRLTGQPTVLVGSPVAGRTRVELEDLIGFFANTLVLRGDLQGDPPFSELLRRVREVALAAFHHQDLPFEKLVEELQPVRDLSRSPLIQVMFAMQDAPLEALALPGLELRPVAPPAATAKFELGVDLQAGAEGLAGSAEYNRDLFDATTIRRWMGHLGSLLAGAAATPERRLSELPLLAPGERHQLLREWDGSGRGMTMADRFSDLLAARVAGTPQAVAVAHPAAGERRLTYGELARRAASLAAALARRGVGPEVRVGLLLERSPEVVVGILGVLAAGGAYVPLDPDYPRERLELMLDDAAPALVLAGGGPPHPCLERPQPASVGLGVGAGAGPGWLDGDAPGVVAAPLRSPAPAEAAAYVLYTSGSAGRPKGVAVSHRSLAWYASAAAEQYGLTAGDRVLQFSSLSFDISVEEIFPCLARGATLVLRGRGMEVSAAELYRRCRQWAVTCAFLPTAFWHELAAEAAARPASHPACLRLVSFGGEQVRPDRLAGWGRAVGARARLFNGYGPTETTVVASLHEPGREPGGAAVIGRPVAGARVYVLDRRLQPQPAAAAGELCIGGAGVARGYLHRPRTTAERFVPDPLGGAGGLRLYRSGDLARWRPGGTLELLGRMDRQVKIRGFRVEPGEVEALLHGHPGVEEAVVTVREERPGDRRLVAYLVPGARAVVAGELAEFLGDRLPTHMLPAAYVILGSLPRTPGGKVDRQALPAPEAGRGPEAGASTTPRNPTEEVLAGVWADVLGVARVGVDESFFDLGGHSLLATRLVSRVRELFGVEVPLRSLFQTPTVAAMAQQVEALVRAAVGLEAPAVTPVPRDGDLPLSYSQLREWFLDQLEPGTAAYNIPSALRLEGALEVAVLARSFDEIVRRHEALRTRFPSRDGRPAQVIAPRLTVALPVVDLGSPGGEARDALARRLAAAEADRSFHLATGPLVRLLLLRLGRREHVVCATVHHIVADGWSMGVLIAEMTALYAAFAAGRPSPLPELAVQYADFAAWQRRWLAGKALETLTAHWRRRLGDPPPVLALPADRPRPAVRSVAAGRRPLRLAQDLTARLRELGGRRHASLFMTVLAAFKALLHRVTGQDDLAVGTFIANRNRAEIEPLIGFFVNTLVLRTDVRGNPDFNELLERVRVVTLEAYAHQDLPFEMLLEALQLERSLSHTPLFQAMLVLQNTPLPELELPGLAVGPFGAGRPRANFDLTLWLEETGGAVAGNLEYSVDLFDATTAERLGRHLESLLRAAVEEPRRPVGDLPLLAPAELHQLLAEWNAARPELAPPPTFPRVFAARAAAVPDATAVADPAAGGARLSYGELARRSGRLARELAARGVGAEVRVGLVAERSLELVEAILGVLGAGGAYVPLDPDYPRERLELMLTDSGAALLVAGGRPGKASPAFAGGPVPVTVRSLLAGPIPGGPEGASPPAHRALPEAAAYVLYTSGSTGRPKGVVVSHRSLAWYAAAGVEHYALTPGDRTLQFSSPSFDISVEEIFPTLARGAVLVLRTEAMAGSVEELYRRCREWAVTGLFLPTAFWHELAAGAAADPTGVPASLRVVCFGGERVLPERVEDWLEAVGRRCRLINSYGPTETTVVATIADLETAADPWGTNIGRPVPGARVYAVDARGRPAPAGTGGEMWIGGPGVARGYAGLSGATARAFVPDPWSRRPGSRLYRTGDRVRCNPRGELEFLGRLDEQVKIRGFRVEPGEVEAAVRDLPGIRAVAVVAREEGPGRRRLVAYVVPSGAPEDWEPGAAADALRRRLPAHALPAAWVPLAALPTTPTGKLDRAALPAPGDTASFRRDDPAPPSGPEEAALAAIWAEVLGRERVGRHDNFFELGGDSILGIQIVSRAARAGLRIQPRQIFEHQTVAALAAAAERGEGVAAEQGPVTGAFPPAPYQRFFFELDPPERYHWNMAVLLAVAPELAAGTVRRAWTLLVAHHDALRLRFDRVNGGWRGRNAGPGGPVPFLRVDLAGLDPAERPGALAAVAGRAQASLDLEWGPVAQAVSFGLGSGGDRLLLAIHHTAVDGVSWRVLVEDLEATCRQLAAGGKPGEVDLPPKTTSFVTWARRLAGHAQSPELLAQADAWLAGLAGPVQPLPTDLPGDPATNTEGSAATVEVELPDAATRALLQEVPRVYNTRIDDALLTALARAFARWTGTPALRVDLEGHGREELVAGVDLSRTVGCFTALYPVVLDLARAAGPGEALKAVKERLRRVPAGGLGYGLLRYPPEETGISRRLASMPGAEVSFNYLGQLDRVLPEGALFAPADEGTGPIRSPRAPRAYLLEILGRVAGGRLHVSFSYSERRHRRATVERLAAGFREELLGLIDHCLSPGAGGRTPSDFPLAALGEAALEGLLGGLPEVEDLYPLTPLQEGMLFESLLAPGSGIYCVQTVLGIRGELEPGPFQAAWQEVVDRHPVLRSAFVREGLERPLAAVLARARLPFELRDLRHLPQRELDRTLNDFLEEDRRRGFEPRRAPLMRITLLRSGEATWHLVWSHHHLLLDAWSGPRLLAEVLALYRARRRGEAARLPDRRPFRDYIAWLKGRDLTAAEAYWRRALEGFTEPTPLGVDRPGPEATGAGHPRDFRQEEVELSAAASRGLEELARRHRLTGSTLLQGAWAVLLARYSGRRRVLFGVTAAGRPPDLTGSEAMIGPFINTLPLAVEVPPQAAPLPWLRRLRDRGAEIREHEHTPLAAVHGWSPVPRDLPLFESLVLFENHPAEDLPPEGLAGLELFASTLRERTNYPLTVMATPGPRLRLRLLADTARFGAASSRRALEHLARLLGALAREPGAPLGRLPLLSPAEVHQVLREWNQDRGEEASPVPVHRGFARQAHARPEALAVTSAAGPEGEGVYLSYGALAVRAGGLARELARRGVGPEEVVGLLVERSPGMVAAVLAVLAAGGAYLPLAPGDPPERLAALLTDAGVRVVVARGGTVPPALRAAAGRDFPAVDLDAASGRPATLPGVSPGNLAYALYTSGSTGRPKGVLVPHRGVAGAVGRSRAVFGVGPGDRVLGFAAPVFDAWVLETFLALTAGAALCLAGEEARLSGEALGRFLAAYSVTTAVLTPAVLALLEEPPPSLVTVSVGGESCPGELAHRWAGRLRLLNCYGPTEATIYATVERCGPASGASPSIGRPLPGVAIYLTDAALEPVAAGVAGELAIAGPGVARGYQRRPGRTAASFVPDPFAARPGGRLYRTGDRARHLPDGRLDFLGRIDRQVKLRGLRIEPGEIEVALGRCPGVGEALVALREDTPGEPRLVAYCTAAAGAPPTPAGELRERLAATLPEHMLPAAFVVLEAFPLTVAGKVDRRALPAPEAATPVPGLPCYPPAGPVQEVLAGIWEEVLGRERIGAREDFFELGGYSLLATRLLARVGEVFGREVTLWDFFEAPTVAGLAAALETSGAAAAPPLAPVPRHGELPLSFAQQRLWFLDRLTPGSSRYNLPAALLLEGELRPRALASAAAGLAVRHEVLRSTFPEDQGRPRLELAPPGGAPAPRWVDLSRLPPAAAEEMARRLSGVEAGRPFDLERGPLLRLTALSLGPGRTALVLNLHHIVTDGWSMGILVPELAELYRAAVEGRSPALPELPVQYPDYAVWQRRWLEGEALAEQLAYWRRQLEGAPGPVDLPLDRLRHAAARGVGALAPFALAPAAWERLRSAGRRAGATPFMVLLAGFGALLGRYGDGGAVTVGTPVANRRRPELEGLVGLFVNTLALPVDLGGDPAFPELLERARGTALGAFTHQDLPFERLVEELAPERDLSRAPLFQVMLVLQDTPGGELVLPGLSWRALAYDWAGAAFDWTLSLEERDGGLTGGLEYDAELFDAATARRALGHLTALLLEVGESPERRVSELALLAPAERHQLLVEAGDTRTSRPAEPTLDGLFREQAARTPGAVAVAAGRRHLSFAALARRAGGLARRLAALGVGGEVVAGLAAEPCVETVAGLLGILEAGGAWLPLEPSYPRERLALVLADARPAVLLAPAESMRRLLPVSRQGDPVPVLLEAAGETRGAAGASGPSPPAITRVPAPIPATADRLAYVLYTSGSTGRPKGVMVSHRAIANRVLWMAGAFPVGAEDRVLARTPGGFDASIWELFLPLVSGARLVLPEPGRHGDTAYLARVGAREGVTVMQLVPSLLQLLAREAGLAECTGLRRLFSGGEALPASLARDLARRLPGAELVNLYGPTEAAIDATFHRARRGGESPAGTVPIGAPLDNVRVQVVDRRLRPRPLGVAGELTIAGAGLARGYLGRPGRTAASFVPDPFPGGGAGGRRYRTGDRVRWRPGGRLEFLGRLDHQVKVRGVRVEPGEVEAALASHPAVGQAAVVARERGIEGTALAAYWVATGGGEEGPSAPTAAELRRYLASRLPAAMVPGALVELPALPRTPSGKLDRRALPEPGRARSAAAERLSPRTPAEEVVAEVWSEVLGVAEVGLAEDFFDLGGHSLLATQVVSRLGRAFGVELPVRSLFEAPTVGALARAAEEARRAGVELPVPPVRPRPRRGHEPLSLTQERLWFLDRLEPGLTAYNVPACVELAGALDLRALAGALAGVRRRHEVLRTRFPEVNGRAVQVVEPPTPGPAALPLVDLSALPHARRRLELERLAAREAGRPFDLAVRPPERGRLVRLAPVEHALLLTLHHIITDGWSTGILVREVAELYEAGRRGREPELPELPVQYADFACWQRRELPLDAHLEHWRHRLAGASEGLSLPLDRPRPPEQTYRGTWVDVALPEGTRDRLRALCRSREATPFMVLLAAFYALLHRYTGDEDLVVGSPIAGRNRPELEDLIGFFVNTLVLRTGLDGDPGFGTLVDRVRETALAAYAHQDLPFERLVEELSPRRDLSRTPLFQVLFVLQNAPVPELELAELELRPLGIRGETVKFDLSLELTEGAAGFQGSLELNRDLFDRTSGQRLARHFEALVAAAVRAPETPVGELPLLAAAERQAVLLEWAGVGSAPVPARALHHPFLDRAAEVPEAVAVVGPRGVHRLSYRGLAARARGLAERLAGAGVGPEVPVALLLGRGVELVAAVLGVLEAGGAYVPLDPAYPGERIAFMLADSGAPVLLAGEGLDPGPAVAEIPVAGPGGAPSWLPAPGPAVLRVGIGAGASLGRPGAAAGGRATRSDPEHPFAILYTSGSTGRPKGVVVRHGGGSALVAWAGTAFEPRELSGVLAATSICFDLSVFELCAPLSHGGTVLLAASALDLPSLPAAAAVSLVNTVPSVLRGLLEGDGLGASVLTVNLAGEPLPEALAARAYAAGARRVLNLYGPSEETTYSTCSQVPRESEGRPPAIGRPLPGTRAFLLDRRLGPAPPGAVGELCLAGVGLARGYLRRPGMTAARFVPDPFDRAGGGRLYRTGDLARLRSAGELEFLGRADQQVKLRGFRIELGEVEAALARSHLVEEGAVAVRQGASGWPVLVAFVVLRKAAEAGEGNLRAALRRSLPENMVPARFVAMESLPRTPTGKLDRRALPALPEAAEGAGAGPPPAGSAEAALAAVWSEVLGVPKIGLDDDFFRLGGDSILSVQVVARAARAGLRLTPRQIFQHPTVGELAAVARGAGAATVAPQAPVTGPVPLTPIQRWFFGLELPAPHHFNQSLLLAVEGGLDARALAGAVRRLLVHHDALRLRFTRGRDGVWRQHCAGPRAALPVPLLAVDLGALAAGAQRRTLRVAAAGAQASLDLTAGPLLRAVHLRGAAGQGERLLLVIHHLAVDGVSWRIALEDLTTAYRRLRAGEEVVLPPKTTSYRDWARALERWAQSAEALRRLEAWVAAVGERQALPLPRDLPAGSDLQTHAATLEVEVPAAESRTLLEEAPAFFAASVEEVLLTALARTLAGWTGGGEALVELEGHGRDGVLPELDASRTVGWFTALYPVRLPAAPGEAPAAAVAAVRERLRRLPDRGVSYGALRSLAEPWVRERLGALPRPEVVFNYLGQIGAGLPREGGLGPAPEGSGPDRAPENPRTHLLEVFGHAAGGRLSFAWTYGAGVHHRSTIEALTGRFLGELRSLAAACSAPAAAVSAGFEAFGWGAAELEEIDVAIGEALGEEPG